MVAYWSEQVDHGRRLVRASGSWLPIGQSKWVMVAYWSEQVDHGRRLVRASGSWLPIGQSKWVTVAYWSEQVGHGSLLVRASDQDQIKINFVYWLAIRKSRATADTAATWNHYTWQ